MSVSYNNLAFTTPEPPDGTWLVVTEDRHMNHGCPVIIWRDDERAARFFEANHRNPERRWFRNDQDISAETWGEVMVHAVTIHGVDKTPIKTLQGERHLPYGDEEN